MVKMNNLAACHLWYIRFSPIMRSTMHPMVTTVLIRSRPVMACRFRISIDILTGGYQLTGQLDMDILPIHTLNRAITKIAYFERKE